MNPLQNILEMFGHVHQTTELHLYAFNSSIQDYLYSAFYDTTVVKLLYWKLSFYNRFIYCRNLIYLTYGKMWLILCTSSEVHLRVGIISSQVFLWLSGSALRLQRKGRGFNSQETQ